MSAPNELELLNSLNYYRKKKEGFIIIVEIFNFFFLIRTTDFFMNVYVFFISLFEEIKNKFKDNKQSNSNLKETKYISIFNKNDYKIDNMINFTEELYKFQNELYSFKENPLKEKISIFFNENKDLNHKELNKLIENTCESIKNRKRKLNLFKKINNDINLQNLNESFYDERYKNIKFHSVLNDYNLFDFIINSELKFCYSDKTYIFMLSKRDFQKIFNEMVFLYGLFNNFDDEMIFFILTCLLEIKKIKKI